MIQMEFMQILAVAMASLVHDLSAALDLSVPFTAVQLCDAVQRWRRIRIDLVPYRMGKARIYGLCKCVRPRHYIIFYRCDGTTSIQQQRIIFHELCHIILSHVSPLNPMHALRDPLTVTLQDQEAEMFAEIANRSALALGRRLQVRKSPVEITTDSRLAGSVDAVESAVTEGAVSADEPDNPFDAFLNVMGGQS